MKIRLQTDYIQIENTSKKINRIEIYNQADQILIEKSKEFDRLDVSALQSGVYFIKFIQGEDVSIAKILVER